MARKPNYEFERRERDRLKAIKVAEKAQAKREARERARLENAASRRATAELRRLRSMRRRPDALVPRTLVKIEPRQVDAFLKKPDPRIRGVVVYGNDDGLIAERAVAARPDRVRGPQGSVPRRRYRRRRAEGRSGAPGRRVRRHVADGRPARDPRAAGRRGIGGGAGEPRGGHRRRRADRDRRRQPHAALRPARAGRDRGLPGGLPCYMDNEAALEGLVESAARRTGLDRRCRCAGRGSSSGWAAIAARPAARSTSSCSTRPATSARPISLEDAAGRAGRHRVDRHRRRRRRHLRRRARRARPRARSRVRRGRQSGAARARPAAPRRPAPSRVGPCRERRQSRRRDVQGARPAARRPGAPALRAPSARLAAAAGSARRCRRSSRPSWSASRRAIPTRRSRAGCAWRWRRRHGRPASAAERRRKQ